MLYRWFWTISLALGFVCVFQCVEIQACTSIMVGRKASTDGSVMTSHTCDSHHNGSEIVVVPHKKHQPGDEVSLSKREEDESGPMKRYSRKPTGKIPQVSETFGYLAPAYAAMNEHQVAIGESTFGGRKELHSQKGLVDCDMLTRLMLERAKTAREAIRIGGELIEKYGWCDEGETLTIADPREVWVMEIVGPGKDAVGVVWAAQRVPDDHVSVVANGSRIGEIDLSKTDEFMASKNVTQLAKEWGYWDPKSGVPFRFYDAYSPESRTEIATTRREWRALDLLAPSLKLHPNSNCYPFSVKPDKPVSPEMIMEIFRDTFEGTDFDMVKDLTVVDEDGKASKSPLANPFMPYDMNKLLKINGGWGWLGERCMARWYCMYVTVTQSRGWLPDPRLSDRWPNDGLQPALGVVGVQPCRHAGCTSLGRHANRCGRGPRPPAEGVFGRTKVRRGHGGRIAQKRPGESKGFPHRKNRTSLSKNNASLLEPRRPPLEQIRRAVVSRVPDHRVVSTRFRPNNFAR